MLWKREGRKSKSNTASKASVSTLLKSFFIILSGLTLTSETTSLWWSAWEISIEKCASAKCRWSWVSSIEICSCPCTWSWSRLCVWSFKFWAHSNATENDITQTANADLLIFRKIRIGRSVMAFILLGNHNWLVTLKASATGLMKIGQYKMVVFSDAKNNYFAKQ